MNFLCIVLYSNLLLFLLIFIFMGPAESKRPPITEQDKRKLESGKAINIKGGVCIKVNRQTGKLQGVPQQWVKNYDLPIPVDESKLVKTKHFYKQIRPEQQIPEAILNAINNQPIPISKPTNFKHVMHLQVDINSEFGIKGLPQQWQKRFKNQDIKPAQIKQNPQAMIEVIRFLQKQEFNQPENKLLSNSDFQKILSQIKIKDSNPNTLFKFKHELGKGAMCTVYYAVQRNDPTKQVAVRRMKVQSNDILQKIKIQIAVMSMCKNPNIVNYIDAYQIKTIFFMFIEYMDGGCLYNFIQKYQKNIPMNLISFIMRQILLGLLPLHQHKQIHRDLKSDNVLIDQKGNIKVADFGFAIQLTKEKQNRKSTLGTPAWMAPQLIKNQDYNELVDVWSLGVIAVQLAQGQPPYLRLQPAKTLFFIKTKQPYRLNKQKFPAQLCNFIEVCLEKDVSKRWSIKKLLKHPFITKIGTGQKQREQFATMVQKMKNSPPVEE